MKTILRRLLFLIVLFTHLFVSVASGQDENVDPQAPVKIDDAVLKPLDVFELEVVSDAQIHPSGKQIVYVRQHFDIMTDRTRSSLWMYDPGREPTEGQENLPLMSGAADYVSPRWSRDGSRLAYVSNHDGSMQIHCYWPHSKRSVAITRVTQSPGSISWSNDGKWIAFSMRIPEAEKPFASMPAKPKGAKWAEAPETITKLRYRVDGAGYLPGGYRQIFIVSSSGGTPRQITSGPYDHGGNLCWTQDNKELVFSANRREDSDYQPRNSELYKVDVATREVTPLTDRLGPDGDPIISPDGSLIAYTGYDDQFLGSQNNKLYVMKPDGTASRVLLGDLDRNIGGIRWNSSPQGVFFQYDESGKTKLGFVDLKGTVTKGIVNDIGSVMLGRPYASGMFTVNEKGRVAYTQGNHQRPADLAMVQLGEQPKTLTHLNDDLFAFKTLGKVEEINFKSSHDGIDLQGWIVYPPNFDKSKKYPLILEIHGGPFMNYGDRFSAECQLYAAAGNVVLYMNPRGSTSYGQDFANLIHHNYPNNDYDDLMSGVDAVIAKGFIDEKNLFVTGGSGGGVLTAWIVGKTDRFRAAVVAKPVINWYSFALTADMYNYFYKYWFPGLPWDHTEEYMKRSPISLVGNVKTPTMLLTGTDDFRTPMSESEQYYQALKLLKVDTALVRIPGAGHGIASRPSRLIAKTIYILKWFDEHRFSKEKE